MGLSDFKQADRVEHVGGMGLGIVASIKDGRMTVIYDKETESRFLQHRWRGVYDEDWFRICPGLLRKVVAS